MQIIFSPEAFDDLCEWAQIDQKIHSKIATLIKDIRRSPFQGLGKPEPLKHKYSGYWSRRITGEHRLIYKIGKEKIFIVACKYHY
ncbi:MAG TPA: Txe/YoeB family addiction module toxin [Treponemataceae bacterium]|jgi:toxin YoeB|nr:Txe/YoeB family addiction module toxin [Treponemataceae bacterium]